MQPAQGSKKILIPIDAFLLPFFPSFLTGNLYLNITPLLLTPIVEKKNKFVFHPDTFFSSQKRIWKASTVHLMRRTYKVIHDEKRKYMKNSKVSVIPLVPWILLKNALLTEKLNQIVNFQETGWSLAFIEMSMFFIVFRIRHTQFIILNLFCLKFRIFYFQVWK